MTTDTVVASRSGVSRRRWKNFLIHSEYQLRYAGQMALVAALLTAALGALVWRYNDEASRVVDLRALDPTDVEAALLKEAFARNNWVLVVGLIGFGVLLSVALALWQIVTSHKVAGPLYYVAHQTRRVREGYLGKLHPLRRRDLLHAFFEDFRAMHEALRDRAAREAVELSAMAERAERAGDSELAATLRRWKAERETALGDSSTNVPPTA